MKERPAPHARRAPRARTRAEPQDRPGPRARRSAAPRAVDADKLTFRPLTPSRWSDLEQLFGERGACGGCWCMAWRLARAEFDRGKGAGNRRAFQTIVQTADAAPGVLAYHGRTPVGWCAIAPRQVYVALERSRVLKPIDDQPVWSVSCFFVHKDYRERGVGVKLLDAACQFAKRQGARIVEGYPVVPTTPRLPAVFAWVGVPGLFLAAGFVEAKRASRARRIMRRAL